MVQDSTSTVLLSPIKQENIFQPTLVEDGIIQPDTKKDTILKLPGFYKLWVDFHNALDVMPFKSRQRV